MGARGLLGDEGVDEVAGHLARGGAAAEQSINAQPSGRAFLESGPADDQKRHLAGGVRLPESGRHRLGVVDMGILLGDDLADEDGIGALGSGALDEIGHEHLGTEIDHLDLPVVLEPLLAGEALDVEDRVDADRVRVRADAGADNDEFAPQPSLDLLVDVF